MNRTIIRILSHVRLGLLLVAFVAIGLVVADISNVYGRRGGGGRGGGHRGGGMSRSVSHRGGSGSVSHRTSRNRGPGGPGGIGDPGRPGNRPGGPDGPGRPGNRPGGGDRDVDVDVDHDHHGYHPVAAGLTVGAAIAIGTRVATLPYGCSQLVTGTAVYYDCGGAYYRSYYQGTEVVYVVVEQP
jgi:hypothetical protein